MYGRGKKERNENVYYFFGISFYMLEILKKTQTNQSTNQSWVGMLKVSFFWKVLWVGFTLWQGIHYRVDKHSVMQWNVRWYRFLQRAALNNWMRWTVPIFCLPCSLLFFPLSITLPLSFCFKTNHSRIKCKSKNSKDKKKSVLGKPLSNHLHIS